MSWRGGENKRKAENRREAENRRKEDKKARKEDKRRREESKKTRNSRQQSTTIFHFILFELKTPFTTTIPLKCLHNVN